MVFAVSSVTGTMSATVIGGTDSLAGVATVTVGVIMVVTMAVGPSSLTAPPSVSGIGTSVGPRNGTSAVTSKT